MYPAAALACRRLQPLVNRMRMREIAAGASPSYAHPRLYYHSCTGQAAPHQHPASFQQGFPIHTRQRLTCNPRFPMSKPLAWIAAKSAEGVAELPPCAFSRSALFSAQRHSLLEALLLITAGNRWRWLLRKVRHILNLGANQAGDT